MAKKPVPCGGCHKAMIPINVPYVNASSDFSLSARDLKNGIEEFTAEDGKTYVYIPFLRTSGGKSHVP